jgi:DNA-binding IclR family transcriptional regulator
VRPGLAQELHALTQLVAQRADGVTPEEAATSLGLPRTRARELLERLKRHGFLGVNGVRHRASDGMIESVFHLAAKGEQLFPRRDV